MMDRSAEKEFTGKLLDNRAFRLIYERYWSQLYKLCFYYTRSREDSEDLVVSIFMSLWNNRNKTSIDNIEHYLVKAAKYKSLKYLVKQQREREKFSQFRQKMEKDLKEEHSPELILETKEMSGRIRRRIEALPEKTRKIFLLNREKGLTYREIALFMGVSEKTVEYHISKVLSSLGKYIVTLIVLLMHA